MAADPPLLRWEPACPLPHPPPQVGPSLAINYMAYETMRSVWLARTDRQTPTVRGVSTVVICLAVAGGRQIV